MKRKVIQAVIAGILVSGIVLAENSINVSAVSKIEESDVSATQTENIDNVQTPNLDSAAPNESNEKDLAKEEQSKPKEVEKTANNSKPDINKIKVYDVSTYYSGRIEGLDETMEYSIDNGSTWISVYANYIDMLPEGKVLIRYKETDTTLPGESIEVTVGSRPMLLQSKPDVNSFKVKNATKGNKNGRIDVINEGMEYSLDGGKSWDFVYGTVIEGLGAGEVLIRYPQGRYLHQSEAVSVVISEEESPLQYQGDSLGGNNYKDDSTYVKTSDTANRSILYTVALGMLSLAGLALSKLNFSKLKKVRVRK